MSTSDRMQWWMQQSRPTSKTTLSHVLNSMPSSLYWRKRGDIWQYVYLRDVSSRKKCPLVCFMHGLIVNQSIKFDSLPLFATFFSQYVAKRLKTVVVCVYVYVSKRSAKLLKKVFGLGLGVETDFDRINKFSTKFLLQRKVNTSRPL